MVRLGKWAENKVMFRDTTTGKRGIQWSQAKRDGFYRLCWFGPVLIPRRRIVASGVGRGEYGKTYGGRILGGTGQAIVARHNGTFATTAWGHGIDNVVGAIAQYGANSVGGIGGGVASVSPTAIRSSVISATIVGLRIEGFTINTVAVNLFVWGATTQIF